MFQPARMIRSLSLALCALLSIIPMAQPQNAGEGKALTELQRYTVKGEEFSVLLPNLPAMDTATRFITVSDDRRERTIGAYADGVTYAVWSFENKRLKQKLEDVIKIFPSVPNQVQKQIDLGKIKGREFSFQTPQLRGVTQFYITENNIYVFKVFASELGDWETGIPKFLNSITFGKDLTGEVLKDGPGFQATGPATASEIFSGKEVEQKVRVATKPEPTYTETARRNEITGTVVLRCVFSANGSATNIHVVSGLPDGLNERAIEAARGIRFLPAVKSGHFVSMWMELQYNFNLY